MNLWTSHIKYVGIKLFTSSIISLSKYINSIWHLNLPFSSTEFKDGKTLMTHLSSV